MTKHCSHCGKAEVRAKGYCQACYYRLRKTGSLEYQRWHKPPKQCEVDDCDAPVVAKGLCNKHYYNKRRTGNEIPTFGYGERKKHRLYYTWSGQVETAQGRVPRWKDFWIFIDDVGEKPGDDYTARRYDSKEPWGPENFYWLKRLPSADTKKEYQKQWIAANPLKAKAYDLKKKFGITLEEYVEIYDKQDGRCDICGNEFASYAKNTTGIKTLAVDHCHDTNKIRGLLCGSCNIGIGMFKDNPDVLNRAIEYLKKHKQ